MPADSYCLSIFWNCCFRLNLFFQRCFYVALAWFNFYCSLLFSIGFNERWIKQRVSFSAVGSIFYNRTWFSTNTPWVGLPRFPFVSHRTVVLFHIALKLCGWSVPGNYYYQTFAVTITAVSPTNWRSPFVTVASVIVVSVPVVVLNDWLTEFERTGLSGSNFCSSASGFLIRLIGIWFHLSYLVRLLVLGRLLSLTWYIKCISLSA